MSGSQGSLEREPPPSGTKRFILWDDIRPVEFAHEKTVPVSLFLSLFAGQHTDIQVSQSFNDGSKDVFWNHGVVLTGKLEALGTDEEGERGGRAAHARTQADALLADVLAIGAVSVAEVFPADWAKLKSWAALRPLEKRRLLQHIVSLASA